MDWNRIEGDWKQLKGTAKQHWGRLTDDDLAAINGRREQLEGKLQERYGYAKDRIKREIEDWATELRAGARKPLNDNPDLAEELDAIRSDVQNLTATLGDVAKRQAGRAQDTAVEAMHSAEVYIKQNPLQAVAIAAGLGFLYGVFTRR
jgi:uncharacterized protein YjbJ (UPF0337 family)/ElaB/YqjD/DUF883 family membrane-anchored ribosome-binding protein